MVIKVLWETQTSDGLFGHIQVWDANGEMRTAFFCTTNLKLRILDGTYMAVIDMSPRLQYNCPHIKVPLRDTEAGGDAGLRIHKANEPSQSLGCIFPGTAEDGDAVDDSKDAFNGMMSLLPTDGSEFVVMIETAVVQ
jgi:hypothetical protein